MKYKLDIDDENPYSGWAFLFFHTAESGYLFVDSLNRLYDLSLSRIDDMELYSSPWPLYTHYDSVSHLRYFLTERPADIQAPWAPGDILLAVKGEDASAMADYIYEDFTSQDEAPEGDLRAEEHVELLSSLLSHFTVVQSLDFTTPLSSSRATKSRAAIEQLCNLILNHIEQKHLDLTEEELRALEDKPEKIKRFKD